MYWIWLSVPIPISPPSSPPLLKIAEIRVQIQNETGVSTIVETPVYFWEW
ncbi:hypothetical protein NDK43_23285 [Neobacillus pocheonensis]|uniref:Uncharacterized protein n=1 Tax=Neobacillus pocheonensis TaxID=363869 RepID=A0ABT0WEJ2_9BACI|nr:hypothetical protein [Neobacillus pocheonensis]